MIIAVRRGGLGFGVVAVVACALAGCAGVPDSGPVRVGRPVAAAGGGLADVAVREVPAGPQPGATPVQLVGSFLRAMVDSDGGYGVGRSYLAPGTAWSTTNGITVFAEPSHVVRTGHDTVVVRARRVGVLSPHGVYRREPGSINRHFQLARRDGQWRIARLDSGVLLSSDDAGRLLQPAALYFLTPSGDSLVPQPVLEPPQEPGLATTLIRGLLAGPGPLLAPGVRTAVPRGTTLVGNVPISADGVAEVDLSAGARQVTAQQLRRLSAQVVWTLDQLSSVTAVRLLASGVPLEAPGVASLQPAHSWQQFDPAPRASTRGALLIGNGRVLGLDADVPPSLPSGGLVAATRTADGDVVAAVRTTGSRQALVVGGPVGQLHEVLRDTAVTALTVGPADEVFAAVSSGDVYSVGAGDRPQRVRLAGRLRHRLVHGLAMSPDGTRVAVVVAGARGAELDVATVVRLGASVAFGKPRVVLGAASEVAGAAWADAQQIVTTTASRDGRRTVVRVSADGYEVHDLSGPGLPRTVDAVAAAPGERVLAAVPAGTWQLVNRRWRKVSAAAGPTYAGG